MSEALYNLNRVHKSYDGRQVLHVERLQIYTGEVLALVGPSGAGKSTLLRLLNFLEPPDGGTFTFCDRPFSADEALPLSLRRRVTTVFQRPLLLNRSVEANVAYGLRLRERRNHRSQIAEVLEQVGLGNLADARASTLSGGEAQRVALARAMALRPDVLLLDEPTANLDPYNVGLIERIVRSLNREQRTTIVLVTHNVFQARRLARRVALLLDGEIVEVADSAAFFEDPADQRTAAFVSGEMIY